MLLVRGKGAIENNEEVKPWLGSDLRAQTKPQSDDVVDQK